MCSIYSSANFTASKALPMIHNAIFARLPAIRATSVGLYPRMNHSTVDTNLMSVLTILALYTTNATGFVVYFTRRTIIANFPFSTTIGAILMCIFISVPFSRALDTIMSITIFHMLSISTSGCAIAIIIPVERIPFAPNRIALMFKVRTKTNTVTDRTIVMNRIHSVTNYTAVAAGFM